MVSKTDALGNVAEFTYNAKGHLTAFEDANDKITAYTHNVFDKVTTTTLANSNIVNYTYDDVGDLIQITDANGNATEYEYDTVYRLRRVINAISLANPYGYRRKITVTTGTSAASSGTSVKIGLDTAPLETASKLRADRRDWRVVAYDRVGKVFTELDRDYLSSTETWFALQSEIAANANSETSGSHSYYVYYGQSKEEGLPPALLSSIYTQDANTTGTLVRNDLNATFMDEDGLIVNVKTANQARFSGGRYEGHSAVLLEPSRTNLIDNSTFEGDVSEWSSTHRAMASASSDRSKHGYYSMKVSPSGEKASVGTPRGTSGIPVSPNRFYIYSGWVYVPSENTQRAKLRVLWWDSRGRLLRSEDSNVAAKGGWQYLCVTAYANPTAAYASLQLRGTDTYATGDVFYFDAVQFEAGRFATSYIPTTNGTATRTAERLTYPTSGNLQTAQGSLSLWVNPAYGPSTAQTRTFFDARTANGNGIRLYRNATDKLVLEIGNGTNNKETRSLDILNWGENTWHHIVATWDRERQKVFVDGTLIASTATPVLPTQFNDDFSIGDSRDASTPAATTFADVALYDRVLSDTDIRTPTRTRRRRRNILRRF